MSLELTNFGEMSRQIAQDFLRTVVVVDDHTVFEGEEVVEKLEPPELVADAAEDGPSDQEAMEGAAAAPGGQQTQNTPVTNSDPHTLPFNRFSDSFAEVGIFCTLLTPEKDSLDQFVAQSTRESGLANRADVVILDWVLYGFKDGEKTLDIISRLAQSEGREKPRKRLLLVYTGENDLLGIAEKIRTRLNVPAPEGASPEEQTRITSGATTIAIFAKPHVKVVKELQKLVIDAQSIPNVVISEFARTSPGLLSNLVVRAMGVLRSETYHILKKFPSRLDPGFVTHKVLQNPEDASSHLLPLIVSEIQSALEDNAVIEVASDPALIAWLDYRVSSGLKFNIDGASEEEAKRGIGGLLKRPVDDVAEDQASHQNFVRGFLKSKNKAKREIVAKLTEVLSGEPGQKPNQEFAALMSVRSRYGTPPPRLALGTILHDVARGIYLLCVQPRCDSVRLTEPRQFPFLPLKIVDAGYDHVVVRDDAILTLGLLDDPYRIEMIEFQPWTADDREVLAKGNGDQLFFKSDDPEPKFRWVAELRPEHSQRIANLLANKISRVGLNESEWLRLIAKSNAR